MRILMVEKGGSFGRSSLCDDRSVVIPAETPEEALSILRHETVDVVVLDVASFSEEGFIFIRKLRAAKNDTPVIALTGRHAGDRVRALSLGADDALAQPVHLGELGARIAAIVRRHKGFSQSLAQVGDLSLSLQSHDVTFRNIPVRLTPKEYSVLELLVLRRGQVVTKEQLLTHLYGGMDEPEMKIIDVFICKLRTRLSRVGAGGLIGTVWGQGFMIRSVGEEISRPQAAAAAGNSWQPATVANRQETELGYAW
jgi:two-component system, cell cycle response regulator CtrA